MTVKPPSTDDRTRRFVAWSRRRGRLIWLVAVLLAIPATWRTARLYLHLRTDVEELLQNLMAEIDLTLALAGVHSVRELDRSWLTTA